MQQLATPTIFPTADEVPASLRLTAPVELREYLCDGRLLSWRGATSEVYSPLYRRQPAASGEEELQPQRLGSYPRMGEPEALAALAAARRAYDDGLGYWPLLPLARRLAMLEELAARLSPLREEVVRLLVWEIGKGQAEADMEFTRTLDYIAATLAAGREMARHDEPVQHRGVLARLSRAPLGVALCLGPSNNPFYETFTLLIPALLMGNTVIYKPPRQGVLLHRGLAGIFQQTLPPGVINTLFGEGEEVLPPLLQTGQLAVLAFIGPRRVADKLRRLHPEPGRLRCLLGLEAKNGAIVLADADLQEAVAECLLGALAFNGQRCTALKMLWVEAGICREFLRQLAAAMDGLSMGMPWRPKVRITPLPELARVDYQRELLADALAKGAEIINEGGGRCCRTFMTPALLYPVTASMRLYHEEQFGPLVPVAAFRDPAQPMEWLKESPFGQQVSLFGREPERLAALVRPLANQVCRVNINCKCRRGPDSLPFSGRKDSAEGTLSVAEALQAFSIDTMTVVRENEENRRLLHHLKTDSIDGGPDGSHW
ncbi:MAG: aldehyde dehydrogenase family protein [Desulfurivibrio sp.]|nr:aldehyde dehydrogenase family protein [Desulfurivibrio sp.]